MKFNVEARRCRFFATCSIKTHLGPFRQPSPEGYGSLKVLYAPVESKMSTLIVASVVSLLEHNLFVEIGKNDLE
jgi:hypothetical protein